VIVTVAFAEIKMFETLSTVIVIGFCVGITKGATYTAVVELFEEIEPSVLLPLGIPLTLQARGSDAPPVAPLMVTVKSCEPFTGTVAVEGARERVMP
jgi:hypothetical protein